MPETYYDVLGIPRKVSKEELAQAYLAQALKWHPVRHPNNPDAERRFALRDMLGNYVDSRLANGAAADRVYDELIAQHNCPAEIATQVVDNAFVNRKRQIRAAGMRMLWHGLGLFSVGAFITAGSFLGSSPGGVFMLWYGPIAFGAAHTLCALWFLNEEKEPPPPYSISDL